MFPNTVLYVACMAVMLAPVSTIFLPKPSKGADIPIVALCPMEYMFCPNSCIVWLKLYILVDVLSIPLLTFSIVEDTLFKALTAPSVIALTTIFTCDSAIFLPPCFKYFYKK
ncbi:TPA: hypothetical protein ACXNW8_001304 [Clostridium botulinum]